jgi:glycosyltransferase involved in cell wall biosynthesis
MPCSLNILLIYDCVYPESLGGVEHRNACLAGALAARGHRVTVAGWVEKPHAAPKGVTILPMAFRTGLYDADGRRGALASLKFALATLKLDVRPFDIVETASIPYIHLLPLALRCALHRKPLAVTWYEYWGSLWRDYKGPRVASLFMGVERFCARLGDAVSASCALTAERVGRVRPGGLTIPVMPCGVSLEAIRQAAVAPAPGVPPLIYAGRLMREKRLDLVLAALPHVPAPEKGPIFGVIGDGPDRERLEAIVRERGLTEKARFYGRLPAAADVWRLVAGARIAVQPSAREGFGLFPLEAMALGLPVVYCAAPDNAIGAVVRDGVEGVCTAPDPLFLAAALGDLLRDGERWKSLSQNAILRAQRYDWGVVAEETERFFLAALPSG